MQYYNRNSRQITMGGVAPIVNPTLKGEGLEMKK